MCVLRGVSATLSAMEQLFGVFAIWLIWSVAESFLTAPKWAWYLSTVVLGVAWQLIAGNSSQWWLGIGLGGAAAVFALVTDLVLIATDRVRLDVLRRNR